MKPARSRAVTNPRSPIPNPGLYGIGTDLLRQERMDKIYARHGERLVKKILCEAEQKELTQRKKNSARYLAMAFAAKEAFVKAFGTGFHGVGYRDAGVVHEKSGKPVLVYSRKLAALMKKRGAGFGHVSLSDEGGLIIAMVVLERSAI